MTRTETIADELIKIFSRVGLPDEILTDQGSNFTSQLMMDICHCLSAVKISSGNPTRLNIFINSSAIVSVSIVDKATASGYLVA
jgi:transposase InsO family protein